MQCLLVSINIISGSFTACPNSGFADPEILAFSTCALLRRYFIPSDGDDPEHPNVFQLHSSSVANGTVRFSDIQARFPLPGSYHFRFKKKFRDGFVWVDISDGSAVVPSYDGVYTAKIVRLSAPEGATAWVGGQGGRVDTASMGSVKGQGIGGGGGSVGGGPGLGSDDLLNMSSGGGAPVTPRANQGVSQQPDDLLGMMGVFDSSHPTTRTSASPSLGQQSPRMPGTPGVAGGQQP
ncbi:unnamed protein product, partial [Choristocarpus tenellus]